MMRADKLSALSQIPGLSEELDRVDELMLSVIDDSRVGKAAAELLNSGGKRLRPAVALCAAAISENKPAEKTLWAAGAVELIHMASMAHDDWLDSGALRRGHPSAASKNPGLAILLGDFLLANAFLMAAEAGDGIARTLANTVADMAVGVSRELPGRNSIKELSQTYFRQAGQKTGSLFAASAAAGAISAGLTAKKVESLSNFGNDFGVAFQIIDDVKDGDISRDKKPAALAEIQSRAASAEQQLGGISGRAADGLKRLPAAYLAWASPL